MVKIITKSRAKIKFESIKYAKIAKKPIKISDTIYMTDILLLQPLHSLFKNIHENIGISSYGLNFLWHFGQRLRDSIKSSPSGNRFINTVAKEPRHTPKTKNINSIKLPQIYGEWI